MKNTILHSCHKQNILHQISIHIYSYIYALDLLQNRGLVIGKW